MKFNIVSFVVTIFVTAGLLMTTAAGIFMSKPQIDQIEENFFLEKIDKMVLSSDDKFISVLLYLTDQVDLAAINKQMDKQRASLQVRHETVVVALQGTAAATQQPLIDYLTDKQMEGKIKDFQCFWISNIIRIDAILSEIKLLAERDDIQYIYPNYEIETIKPFETQLQEPLGSQPENGVQAVRAPEVWALGYTGEGVLVANIDTGVDGSHPALACRWAGVADPRYQDHPEWAWFDPYLGQNDFPYDDNGHGTHTMGTVCGGAPGDQIGVAPGSYWIAAGAIDRGGGIPTTVENAIESFQWMIDPDGNPGTNWDVPAVCSNSWGLCTWHGYPPCDELFWNFLDTCEAAGTLIIFSAGNEGDWGGIRRPADRATDEYRTLAVGAVDAHNPAWPIADFSSRGPTYCTPNGNEAIKPDISAPGVNVRSAWPDGDYHNLDGTSMASPHVNGVVALLRQANPNLTVQQIKQIIYDTAYDLGPAGEDNDYGWGMIDAYEAVLFALNYTNNPDLSCDGDLIWTNVQPGSIVTGNFTVENIGETESLLDWEVTEWPSVGLWDFIPSSGQDLTPEDDPILVGVIVETPAGPSEDLIGEVKIVNKEDYYHDFCIIPVSLDFIIPQLYCEGSLDWEDVSPGETIYGTFIIENIGDPESKLDWEIAEYPDWGEWTFDPNSGLDLTPDAGTVTVDVEVVAPGEENQEFTGEILIVNSNNPDESCTIPVSIKTQMNSEFIQLLKLLIYRFPILGQIFSKLL